MVAARAAAMGVPLSVHLTVAALVLLAALVYVSRGLLEVDETFDEPVGEPATGPVDDVATEPLAATAAAGGRAGLSTIVLVGLWAGGLCAVALESTALDWAAFRVGDDFNRSAGYAALGYVAVTVGMTSARFAGDALEVRLGAARLALVANSVTAVGLVTATLGPQAWISLIGFALVGVGVATMAPALYDRAARLPGPPGVGMGALTAGLRTSGLAVPLLVGAVAGRVPTVGMAMALVMLPALVGYVAVTRSLRPRAVPRNG
jgi:fucose permease